MADQTPISAETLSRIAGEQLKLPLSEADLEAVRELLGVLEADMAAMRAMDVGPDEPATAYDPAETE